MEIYFLLRAKIFCDRFSQYLYINITFLHNNFYLYYWFEFVNIYHQNYIHHGPIMSKWYNRSIALKSIQCHMVTRVPIFTGSQCKYKASIREIIKDTFIIPKILLLNSLPFVCIESWILEPLWRGCIKTTISSLIAMASIPPVRSWQLLDLWHPGVTVRGHLAS